MTDEYADAALRRLLAEDAAIAELGIDVDSHGERIVLRGYVESEQRREEIARRVCDLMPGRLVHNEIVVISAGPPSGPEALP